MSVSWLRWPFLLFFLAACSKAAAQTAPEPRQAGTDVPAPKLKKLVLPDFPAEAQQRGLGGIVLVELLIDEHGRVVEAKVVHSVPGLDEAALVAVRKWQYEETRVGGKPTRVRLTVPISFPKRLPAVTSQPGIPELREGAAPAYPALPAPPDLAGAAVEVTLDERGAVDLVEKVTGESPWLDSLQGAVRLWRFAPPAPGVTVSFRIEAGFIAPRPPAPGRVTLNLTGLRETTAAATAPAGQAPLGPSQSASGAPQGGQAPPSTLPPEPRPPVEIVAVPTPTPVPVPAVPGVSTVPGIALGPAVPDLIKGRRPVVPPLARMAGQTGTVEVRFSVDGAGQTVVQRYTGLEAFQTAAEQMVRSWVFRRTSTERLFLTAAITYGDVAASANVSVSQ